MQILDVPIPLSELYIGPDAMLGMPDGRLCIMGHILKRLRIHPGNLTWCNYPHQLPKREWPKMRLWRIVDFKGDQCWTTREAEDIIANIYNFIPGDGMVCVGGRAFSLARKIGFDLRIERD